MKTRYISFVISIFQGRIKLQVLVAGGCNYTDCHVLHEDSTETRFPLKSAEIYDIETDTWEPAANMPTGLMRGNMVLFEGPSKSKYRVTQINLYTMLQ